MSSNFQPDETEQYGAYSKYVHSLNQIFTPTDNMNGFDIRPGFYESFGSVMMPEGVSFTVYSNNATSIKLALFKKGAQEPYALIPFPEKYRIGNVHSMFVFGLDIRQFEYAYLVDGPYSPEEGLIFDGSKYLLDPYAKVVAGESFDPGNEKRETHYLGRVYASNFDWGNQTSPVIPMNEMIIYEMHVRGFTNSPSSGVHLPGTFAGLADKIPYLKELGINTVELMPIFEFDEIHDITVAKEKGLEDYWGYNTVGFFSPHSDYASEAEHNRQGDELKDLIRKLHENDIEVILDVVFNHTAEGNEEGPFLSFKGLDNSVYYMLMPDGKYFNFSGCGNTFNCNHPIVQNFILDCLRYWVTEYRVDGFRFDLASILGRDENGNPLTHPPLLNNLACDPILANVKLIAEAWDAGGLYQVGKFSYSKRWSEWNGQYRDDVRRFLKGDAGLAHTVAERIAGSHDLYNPDLRGHNASVNFITCHDGFTLHDLFAYNQKHNEANGWANTDGEDYNNSWNCGFEGETEDAAIQSLRKRMVRNACTVLLASQGTPLLLAGDEVGRTQGGNNNAYCQDNEVSWFDWHLLEGNRDLFEFFKKMIHLRKEHPVLRDSTLPAACGLPDSSIHGHEPWYLDPSPEVRYVGIMLAGRNTEHDQDEIAYLGINSHWMEQPIRLPDLPDGLCWKLAVDTSLPAGEDCTTQVEQMRKIGTEMTLQPRTVILLFAEKAYG
ncbi:glycogen operon protein [Trichococcus patagoniensis]|uniref:Glycogen operon protein n=1 Tax=Trichococcus patagoniensis TaxID=382641 RepID=A0A2T5IEG5_9LACT|nr:glycogen debranching protein GlgX [Trichococcus patagoniensis]PTQ82226.1 glycogen operon protein [Trichococcus patagoniensis]